MNMYKKSIIVLSSVVLSGSLYAQNGKMHDVKNIEMQTMQIDGKNYVVNNGYGKVAAKNFIKTNRLEGEMIHQTCDSKMLKSAIAKLIKKIEGLESRVGFLEKEKSLLTPLINNKSLIKKERKAHKKIRLKEPKKKLYCQDKKWSISDVKGSFIKFKEPQKFKIASNNVYEYKNPILNSKKSKEVSLKKGSYIEGDMFTKAGWVHVKDGGWIKGYLVFPKVLQKKDNNVYKKDCVLR